MSGERETTHLEFIETPLFARTRKGLITDEEVRSVEMELLEDPERGSLEKNTGGVRKIRVAREGGGKRGGARVAYLYVAVRDTVYFLFAFTKNVQASLTTEQKARIRKLVETLKGEG